MSENANENAPSIQPGVAPGIPDKVEIIILRGGPLDNRRKWIHPNRPIASFADAPGVVYERTAEFEMGEQVFRPRA